MSGSHKHYFLLKFSDHQKPVRFSTKTSDAKQEVLLHRLTEDVLAGSEGRAMTCANALCALRLKGQFPHPAHFVSFTKNRAYVIDRISKDGRPLHAVRYAHNQGEWQEQFDRLGKKKIIAQGKADQMFVLRPPPKRTPAKIHIRDGSQKNRNPSGWNKEVRGELARVRDAGIKLD